MASAHSTAFTASRANSSSWMRGTGTPNTAMIESPMKRRMTPPCSLTIGVIAAMKSYSQPMRSGGSSDSEMVVKPPTSAKNTVAVTRSGRG